MDFAEILKNETKWKTTENGAVCKNTTDSALLDFFASVGAMRNRSESEIIEKFEQAYQESPVYAIICLFYARDIREGLGERMVFRTIVRYAADKYYEDILKILPYISFYGRFDDYYSLIGTKVEDFMWEYLRKQLYNDINNMNNHKPISLLGKWLKKSDSKNKRTKELGLYTAKKLGMSDYKYRRICKSLRKYLQVTECKMSSNNWDKIDYSSVPSKAMLNYRDAFRRHDSERFDKYIEKVSEGKEKINSSTLYPYDIVEKFIYENSSNIDVLQEQWNALPNYVSEDINALVMADVSGSMYGRPICTSIGLALYFAEHNQGAYHNLFMTFSENPKIIKVKGNTLLDKVKNISNADWGMNTNLEAAFKKILNIAIKNNCLSEELPKSLIIISDMEIDCCVHGREYEQFYDSMRRMYAENGYDIPNIVFWNVNSRHDTFHVNMHQKGVQLISGQSASSFTNLIGSINKTPIELMYDVLNGKRYSVIKSSLEEKMTK